MDRENFIRIPPYLDCRELGQRVPKPVPEKVQGGMRFGNSNDHRIKFSKLVDWLDDAKS